MPQIKLVEMELKKAQSQVKVQGDRALRMDGNTEGGLQVTPLFMKLKSPLKANGTKTGSTNQIQIQIKVRVLNLAEQSHTSA